MEIFNFIPLMLTLDGLFIFLIAVIIVGIIYLFIYHTTIAIVILVLTIIGCAYYYKDELSSMFNSKTKTSKSA